MPANTALGYLSGAQFNEQRTNIFSLPVIGGADGGIYTCAGDLDILWRGVFSRKILSEKMTSQFLKPQIDIGNGKSYGLGVYIHNREDNLVYYAVGGDFGVDFFTACFPERKTVASALGNTEINTYPLLEALISL